jgi:hypothetical protein
LRGEDSAKQSDGIVDRFWREFIFDHAAPSGIDVLESEFRYLNRTKSRHELPIDDRAVAGFRTAADLAATGQPILGKLLKRPRRGPRVGALINFAQHFIRAFLGLVSCPELAFPSLAT